jgi:hypothetical protein
MDCCGNKRAALARERAGVAVTVTRPPAAGESVVFKYVGPGKLALKGAVSGSNYVFTRTGVELAVAREDSVALMSHRYLRVRHP